MFLFSASANGQSRSTTEKVLRDTGKVTVIVVGTAAKITYATTKIVVKEVAKPVAVTMLKPLIVHSIPAITKAGLKYSAKYLLPYVVKLSLL